MDGLVTYADYRFHSLKIIKKLGKWLLNITITYSLIAECLSMRHIILRGQQGIYFSAWLCIYVTISAKTGLVRTW